MAHPKEVDEWVTSIEVDQMAYPGVEQREPEKPVREPDPPPHCPECGRFKGSPGHSHKE